MLTRLIAVIILQYFNISIISTNIKLSCYIPTIITMSIMPQFFFLNEPDIAGMDTYALKRLHISRRGAGNLSLM